MVYKIGLVGTHGTGKTALAGLINSELRRRGIESTQIIECATKARERGIVLNEETTLADQLYLLYTQFSEEILLSREREGHPQYEVIVCDRGPDNYCYLERSVGPSKGALELTLRHLKHFSYNQLYLLPIVNSGPPARNGIRALDPEFQKEMDVRVRTFLSKYDIAHTVLPHPKDDDPYRNEWVRLIVNNTLEDLGMPQECYIKNP